MSSSNSFDRTTPPPSQELALPENPSSMQALQRGTSARRERRNPSVTPRKFKRFFTPRSQNPSDTPSSNPLRETTNVGNRRSLPQSTPVRHPRPLFGQENTRRASRDSKRRKLYHTPDSSPAAPIEEAPIEEDEQPEAELEVVEDAESDDEVRNVPSSPCERAFRDLSGITEEEVVQKPPEKISQVDQRGLSGQLLQLRINSTPTARSQYFSRPINDWRDETASFYSRPEDVHVTHSLDAPHERTIPFCASSCNTNSLVAVGDEEGRVRLLDPDKDSKRPWASIFLGFRVHRNAIIDMEFCDDDKFLATASGDQTARIVDVTTQTTFSILAHHSASLKQVRFMPGSNCILATSSRDGAVKLWDLRCKADDSPRHQFYAHVPNGPSSTNPTRQPTWARPVRAITDTHRYPYYNQAGRLDCNNDIPSRGEAAGRTGALSVTAISFLPENRDHLLLTASESDASVKLWDIRCISNKRRGHIALSQTKQPESHNQFRHFGISSINVNGAGTRLYTVCKDNTVYTYSTAHLILGNAPELAMDDTGPRFIPKETREGLPPMYGFRHPKLHATSFYVKSAIRKAKDGKSEMLAVGSSDGCAILFPTDERYLSKQTSTSGEEPPEPLIHVSPHTITATGQQKFRSGPATKPVDRLLRSTNGTPLIRGHDREVGSVCWTYNGDLVTVGDDYYVRCWHEDRDTARDLRVNGEGDGRRYACGWADVEQDYDEDED